MLKQQQEAHGFDGQMKRLLSASKARTQAELAEILGITQPSISEAKRRKTIPAGWLISLMETMHVNPEWVISGKGKKYLEISSAVHNRGGRTKGRAWMVSLAKQLPARILVNELMRRITVAERGGG